MTGKRLCTFNLLLAAITVAANLQAAGAQSVTNQWQTLLVEEKVFHENVPPEDSAQEQLNAFLRTHSHKALALAGKMEAFYRRDPKGPFAQDAWENWMELLNIAEPFDTNALAQLERDENEFLRDPELSLRRRIAIRRNQIERTRDFRLRERMVLDARDEIERAKLKLPPSTNSTEWVFPWTEELLLIAENTDPQDARRLVREVLEKSKSYDPYRGEARQLQAQLNRVGRRLNLRFRSLDGQTIDLTNYLGKVVLVDFWATWCVPCVGGLPHLKAVRDKLHTRGFEVIGFSYDSDKTTLERFVRKNKLNWPEYFHEQGRGSPLALKLGQPGPPAYWLIDPRGRLVDLNASHNLEAKVERLLKGQPVYPNSKGTTKAREQ